MKFYFHFEAVIGGFVCFPRGILPADSRSGKNEMIRGPL